MRLFADQDRNGATTRCGDGNAEESGKASSPLTGLIANGKGKACEGHILEAADDTPPEDIGSSDRHEPDCAVDVNVIIRYDFDGVADEPQAVGVDLDKDEARPGQA